MAVNEAIISVLKSAHLFKNFTETGLQIVASIAQEKEIPAGTPLFVENMIGDGMYIIAEGRIRLAVQAPSGQQVTLTTLGPPHSLGEAALLRSGPRMCSATAEVPCRVIEIARRDLAMLQRSKPQACLKLMMGVVEVVGERTRALAPDMKAFLAWKSGV